MSIIEIVTEKYLLLVSTALLLVLSTRTESRTDKIALGVCVVAIVAAFLATTYPGTPRSVVLGTGLVGVVLCAGALATVLHARVTGDGGTAQG